MAPFALKCVYWLVRVPNCRFLRVSEGFPRVSEGFRVLGLGSGLGLCDLSLGPLSGVGISVFEYANFFISSPICLKISGNVCFNR